jgi:hypothetical protein
MDIDFDSLHEGVNIIVKYVLKNIINKNLFNHFVFKMNKKKGELLIRCDIIFVSKACIENPSKRDLSFDDTNIELLSSITGIDRFKNIILNEISEMTKKILSATFMKITEYIDKNNITNKIIVKYSSEYFIYIDGDTTGYYYPIEFLVNVEDDDSESDNLLPDEDVNLHIGCDECGECEM